MRPQSLPEVTKEWIDSIPKIINSNGCWIPNKKSANTGYTQIWIGDKYLLLHRLVLSVYHNLDYHDQSWDSRHGLQCDRACFFHEHLKFGTHSDNNKDIVLHGKHHNANKTKCPQCGCPYRVRINKTGINQGKIRRVCPVCTHKSRRK
jgi:hypothetical protein